MSADETRPAGPLERDPSARRPTARYARLVERYCAELGQELGVLSPRDWTRIADWERRGVPLQVVREAIEAVVNARTPRSGRGPRGALLQRVQPLVEETWALMLEGRKREVVRDSPPFHPADPPVHWAQRLETVAADEPLRKLLAMLVSRFKAGEPIAALDAALDAELEAVSPPDLVDEVARVVDEALAPFVTRLDTEQLQRTRRAARIERLRSRLDLPRG